MLFRKRKQYELEDPLEQKLDTISELTKGLGRKELNALIKAVQDIYNVRQSLKNVKTEDEKENEDIFQAEKILSKEINNDN